MDKDQLKEFLDTHCEWRVKDSIKRYAKKELDHFEDNMKWSPLPIEKTCSDCPETVIDRKIEYKLINIGQPNQRYQKKCSICKQYLGRLKHLD
jgi:hypothetical protein